ncbi:MAG: UbiD family decarboxylase [Acidobacteriota bacterium]
MAEKVSALPETENTSLSNIWDLRSWLASVEQLGELKHVSGAHWDLELGGISEINNRQRGPCLLFDDIVDYPSGYRVVTGTTGSPVRLAATLGFPSYPSSAELVEALRGKPQQWEALSVEFPPQYVEDGPVLENVIAGKEINLLDFPVPKWHEKDGGRYIGTGSVVVTKDLDSEWINLGAYRMMVHDERTCALNMVAGKHGRQQIDRYFSAGKPFPVVVSLGHHPLLFLFAGLEVKYGLSEYNYVGGILGEPVQVIKGEVTGLPMPAASELVLEGWCQPGNFKMEGPLGEFHGYYSSSEKGAPVLEVERVYHRNNPILLGTPPARPPHDYSYSKAVMRSALLHEALEKAGVPEVVSCWADEVGGSRMLLVVSIKQGYQGHARQAGLVASQCHVGAYLGRYVIVVDDDIDPSDLQNVMWAVVTRSDPARDIEIITRAWGSRGDPQNVTFDQKVPYNTRAIIDACRAYEYLDVFPPVAEISPQFQEELKKKWKDLLGS